jgi:ankyrin repeat protein
MTFEKVEMTMNMTSEPRRRRCARLPLLLCCLLLAGFPVSVQAAKTKKEYTANTGDFLSFEFLDACTTGDVDAVKALLKEHPGWVNGRSEQGESCLHVAGITGRADITAVILEGGGDPNIRTAFEQGLRMHPLSWNVYGGHLESVAVLLEGGADVNLDVDNMYDPSQAVTVLDLIENILDVDHIDKRFQQVKDLLLKFGAKRYKDLQKQVDEDGESDEL